MCEKIGYKTHIFINNMLYINKGDKSYIQYNLQFECYTDQYYKYTYGLIIPLLVIHTLLFPSIIFLCLFGSRKSVMKMKKYYFFVSEYK